MFESTGLRRLGRKEVTLEEWNKRSWWSQFLELVFYPFRYWL
ncbi:MAG: hypothetical protein U1F29_17765 [Planctomycetota bacterium]